MTYSCMVFAVHPVVNEYINPLMYFLICTINPWIYLYYTIRYFNKLSMMILFLGMSFPIYLIAYFFFITRKVTDHPNRVRIWFRKVLPPWSFDILFCRKYNRLYKRRQNPCYAIMFYGIIMVFFTFFFEIEIYGYVRSDNYGDATFEGFCLYLFISNLFITLNYLIIEILVLLITFMSIIFLICCCIPCIICRKEYNDDQWESRWYVNRLQLYEENTVVANGLKNYIIENLAFKFSLQKYTEVIAMHEQEKLMKLKSKNASKVRSDQYKINEDQNEEAKDQDASDSRQNLCVICYDSIEPNQIVICLECEGNHIFHRRCLNEWINVKLNCPACRADLKELYNQKYQQSTSIPEFTPDDNFLYIEDFVAKFSRHNIMYSNIGSEINHPISAQDIEIEINDVMIDNPLQIEENNRNEEEKENENNDFLIRRNTFDQLNFRHDISESLEIPNSCRLNPLEDIHPQNDISEVPSDLEM